ALLLFGDEASFAQWGSLSYTWALKGQQPEVPTSGKRKAYKVFGLIDYFSGRFFYKAHAGRFNSASYAAFLLDVLSQTTQPVVVIQDGTRYHTSKAMQTFCETHADRLTIEQLPAYSPDFNLRGQNLYASRVSHLQRVGLNILTTRGFPPVVFHKNIFPQG